MSAATARALDRRALTGGVLIAAMAIALATLPALVTFNELMARGAQATGLDRFLADWIVPPQSRLAAAMLSLVRIPAAVGPGTLILGDSDVPLVLRISWNCAGWQSLVLFALSCMTALQGQSARVKAIVIAGGATVVALLNVARIAAVGAVAWWFGATPAVLVHDYGSVLSTAAFLFAFWALAYRTVLRPE